MKKFKQELFNLLCIQAPSGKEKKVADYLFPVLERLCDKVFLDDYGNLLAEKKVGTGEGATIILSAHMDTVNNIQQDRKVLFDAKTNTFHSTKGVLGADDRAGIAIILAVLRNLHLTEFDGTLKIAFSREEETGCVGANHIDPNWYTDANLAIVVDRKGSRDIVTGCFSPYNFCSESVGKFFENTSAMLGMDWKSVGGGVSDATVFSGRGINSVNLSAGYENEHTPQEIVNLVHCRDTINLILQVLSVVNTFVESFDEVPAPILYSISGSPWELTDEELYYAQDEYHNTGEVLFYDSPDQIGTVTGSVVSSYVSLQQGVRSRGAEKVKIQEIFMEEQNFERLIDQYCIITGYSPGYRKHVDSRANSYTANGSSELDG
ncbi:M20/M25/M40 family metallo-hydrolase [Brevibacillus laterosporus]|uniref:M20/M25/M40 family metallo-hydrolase n=1 Tax=Brevibacillus laterosporus TaxID=1465 RepID=UPI003D1FAB58